ncbi:hypothetical protein BGW80DRAFT_1258351 [Lactifluus volemus]|nr:hypothetical protein BGW80DRAFT_1258351 [Lactifluus volemus]
MSNAGTPNTPQTPSRKVYNPIFKELKRSLCNATFIGSFVGEGLPLKPVPYPEEPSGERVAVHDLSAYHQRRCWDMPMCFCGLLTGKDHPARFHHYVFYRELLILVDLEKFILANPNTPRCIYPLRDATHLETKEEETTPTITSSQLPQVEAEVLPPSQAGSSSYSAIGRSDMELLDYGHRTKLNIEMLTVNLEAALRPVDVDSARALLLTIFDPTCPGISITEFLRVVMGPVSPGHQARWGPIQHP